MSGAAASGSQLLQEGAALAIVAGAAFWLGRGWFREWLAGPLSKLALRKGKVELAMRLRREEARADSGCGNCPTGSAGAGKPGSARRGGCSSPH